MNDQSQMMNQHQMMNQQQPQMVNQQPPQMPPPPPTQAQMVNQMVSQAQLVAAANQSKMMAAQNYGQWSQPPPPHSMPPPMNVMKFPAMNQQQLYGGVSKPGRTSNNNNNWKGKKPMDKRKDSRRKGNDNNNNNNNNNIANSKILPGVGGGVGGLASGGPGGLGSYQPPTLYELEQQNRLKARRFYHPKKKFNRMGPYAHAPRNTTSYIIRAKKSGGIASLVSPCPVTPAVLPTPVFSPSREALVDMAKEEWGVDGYGSMKGLIRLRSPGHDETVDDYDEEDDGGSSESDVEEHVEVERRLDHDLSRFEMIYPNSGDYHNVLENRVDDQDTHIAQLEEENLILKERLYLMERELGELRRRLLCLERQNQVVEDINEEVVENVSENDSGGLRNIPVLVNKHNEEVDSMPGNEIGGSEARRDDSGEMLHKELKELAVKDVFLNEEVMRANGTNTGFEDKQDTGLVNEGLGYRLMVDNQDEEHDEDLLMELGKGSSGHRESENYEDVDVSVGKDVDNADAAVNSQLVGDAYMGETLVDGMNENDRPEGGVNVGSAINLNQGEAAEGSAQAVGNCVMNSEATDDICMGDALVTDKEVKDVESHD